MMLSLSEFLDQQITIEEFQKKAKPTFPELYKEFGIHSHSEISRALNAFQNHWKSQSTLMITGVPSLLSCLRFEGFKIVLWTARDEITSKQTLDSHPELHSLVDEVFAFDLNQECNKPLPPKELMNIVQGKKSFLCGDSNSDYSGATRLNTSFFQASWVHSKDIPGKFQICHSPLDLLEHAMKL